MPAEKCSVAIVGAGLSGSLVASGLMRRGCDVTLFDKSRGTGGRLASARIGGAAMDLGAPAFSTQQRSELLGLSPDLEPVLKLWRARKMSFSGQGEQEIEPCYVPEGRSSSLTRHLVQGANLKASTRVGQVNAMPGNVWELLDDTGVSLGVYDQVILAVPAPQAVPLLSARPALQARVEKIQLGSLWVTLLELNQAPEKLVNIDWLTGEHPVFSRLVKDASKPGRSGERWVLQAREDWSVSHIDQTAEQVGAAMIDAFEQLCGETLSLQAQRTHRWLYALPAGVFEMPQHSDGLFVCGDWASPSHDTGQSLDAGLSRACHSAQSLLHQWDTLAC